MQINDVFERVWSNSYGRIGSMFLCLALLVLFVEILAFLGLLASHFVAGRPPVENIVVHPVLSRKIEVFQPWERPTNLHPIYGWLGGTNHKPGCAGHDKYGYRHHGDPEKDYRAGTVKIFVLGGSTAEGSGVCGHETFPAHLEKILRSKLGIKDLHVINAGVSGYFSANELLRLTTEILPQSPDLVISLSGTNDTPFADVDYARVPAFQGRQIAPFFNPSHGSLMTAIANQNKFGWSVSNLARVVLERFVYAVEYGQAAFLNYSYSGYFVAGVKNWIKKKWFAESDKPTNLEEYAHKWVDVAGKEKTALNFRGPWREYSYLGGMEKEENRDLYNKYIKSYSHTVLMSQSAANGTGTPYLLILQPSLYANTRKLSEKSANALEIFSEYFNKFGYDIVSRRRYFDVLAREELGESEISWADFTNIFPDFAKTYVDSVHYSNLGNRLLAEATSDLLISCGAFDNLTNAVSIEKNPERCPKNLLKQFTNLNQASSR